MAKDIIVSIGGDAADLRRELKKSTQQLRKFGNESVKKYGKYAAAATAAGVAVTAAFVKKGLEAADAQAKLAKQLNTTAASIGTMERAGQLAGVSLQQIGVAGRTLDKQLGDASRGVAKSAENFKRLGLNIDEVTRLPLDERIGAINTAIAKNIPLTEQAAVRADMFGSRAGAAVKGLDVDVIAEAARQAAIFGTNLSEIDAARIENANDAISTIGVGIDGLQKQLAAQFAPAIQAIGNQFLGAADEVGGFGTVAENVFNGVVTSVGFVLDAIEGIKRVFQSVADVLIIGVAELARRWANEIQDLLEIADWIPGVNLTEQIKAVKDFAELQKGVINEARDAIDNRFKEPLPSEALKQFIDDAKAASDAAAQAAADAKEKMVSGGDFSGGGDTSVGSNVVDFDSARLDKLREQYATEQEILLEKLEAEREILNEARANKAIDEEEWQALQLAAKESYEQGLTDIEKSASDERKRIAEQEAANRRAVMDGMMSNLASLMNSGSKKMFEIGKKASLAQATISGIEAAVNSYAQGAKVGGPVLGAAFAATSIAATSAKISAIRSQSFGGSGSQAAQASAARSGGATAQTIPQQQQQSQQNIFVQGLNPNQMFSGQQLIDIINRGQEEGGVLKVGGM